MNRVQIGLNLPTVKIFPVVFQFQSNIPCQMLSSLIAAPWFYGHRACPAERALFRPIGGDLQGPEAVGSDAKVGPPSASIHNRQRAQNLAALRSDHIHCFLSRPSGCDDIFHNQTLVTRLDVETTPEPESTTAVVMPTNSPSHQPIHPPMVMPKKPINLDIQKVITFIVFVLPLFHRGRPIVITMVSP